MGIRLRVAEILGRGHADWMKERLLADDATQGSSIVPHPILLWREKSGTRKIQRAKDLHSFRHVVR
jgi:hypothetical protein